MTSTEYKEQLSAALRKIGGMLPLGFEYTRLTGQNAPLGGVDYLGQTATRAMYADLWAWLNKYKPDAIVTESEWQSLYASQNGNVGKFSDGDGSTTFRFPRVVGYFKGAGSTDVLGQYIKEGLPDASHTHTRGTMNITGRVQDFIKVYWNGASAHGAFGLYGTSGKYASGSEGTTNHNGFDFDASRSWTGETSVASLSDSNPIFGNSPHVTPETVTVVMGVIAIGSVASIGEATEEGIVAELGELGTKLGELESEVESKADASALGSKVSSINGMMTFDLDNGSTVELRRAGDAGSYTLSVVYIAENGTKKFGVLMNSEGEFLPGAFYAPNVAAGVSYAKGSTNTIPSNGYLKGTLASSDYDTVDLTINGTVFQIPTDTGHNTMLIPVKKGDTVKYTDTGPNWGSSVTFYPAR